ncbi:hypothetical protein [Streptomyces sp. CT34]|uniref:hypothetical protein n=1 Tax=Streptomyces sp. CT34 TaxID=1553907 RepID=UPI001F524005|nr:hypothetical protein [Streptomyces sp. CT34]
MKRSTRRRQVHPSVIGPHEAFRLVSFLLGGAAQPDDGEPEVYQADVTVALSLLPLVRGELDELETGLLQMARSVVCLRRTRGERDQVSRNLDSE